MSFYKAKWDTKILCLCSQGILGFGVVVIKEIPNPHVTQIQVTHILNCHAYDFPEVSFLVWCFLPLVDSKVSAGQKYDRMVLMQILLSDEQLNLTNVYWRIELCVFTESCWTVTYAYIRRKKFAEHNSRLFILPSGESFIFFLMDKSRRKDSFVWRNT